VGADSSSCSRSAGLSRLQRQQHAALADLIAQLDRQTFDDTRMARGNFEAGFVAFHRDERLLSGHGIAHGDQHFNHRHIMKIAHVGHYNLNVSHGAFL
jgi:hypothetical protein